MPGFQPMNSALPMYIETFSRAWRATGSCVSNEAVTLPFVLRSHTQQCWSFWSLFRRKHTWLLLSWISLNFQMICFIFPSPSLASHAWNAWHDLWRFSSIWGCRSQLQTLKQKDQTVFWQFWLFPVTHVWMEQKNHGSWLNSEWHRNIWLTYSGWNFPRVRGRPAKQKEKILSPGFVGFVNGRTIE